MSAPDDYPSDRDELNSYQIVKLLKSDDGKERAKALDVLYPGQTVTLVTSTLDGKIGMSSSSASDIQRLFVALSWATQQIGKGIGFTLQWVQTKQDQGQILVAKPGQGQMPLIR